MDSGRISTAIVGKMFLMSLFSIISLFVGLSAIGIWKGSQRHSFNTIIIKLGGAQYMAGAGFLIAAVLALLSIKLSLFVLIITLLSMLILTVTASIELFEVTRERRTLYIVSSIASYSLLLMLLGSITI